MPYFLDCVQSVSEQYLEDHTRPVFLTEKAAIEHTNGCMSDCTVFPKLVAVNEHDMLLMQPLVAPGGQ